MISVGGADLKMIDPILSVIIAFVGVIVGGIITFVTTYVLNERRYKYERISGGIAFYRSMLKEVLPLLKKVAQIREALISLKTANEKVIQGEKGFPILYIDSDKGPRHLKNLELRTVIAEQLVPESRTFAASPWMAIMPANVSVPFLMLLGMVSDLTTDHWNDPPTKILKLVDEAQQVLEDLDISMYKMLGLLPAYRAIHATKPGFTSNELRKFMEKRLPD